MIDHIGQWLKVLIVVVILGNLVDFALPKGSLKRYGGLVVGLVILAVIVSPLWSWMHQIGHLSLAAPAEGWTNSPSGFNQVVKTEELHQAEAIVLSMPGVTQCQLTAATDGAVYARIRAQPRVTAAQARHFVSAALKVTMGQAPPITLSLESESGSGGHRVQLGNSSGGG